MVKLKTVATKIAVAKTAAIKTVKTIATNTAATMTKKKTHRIPAPTQKALELFPEPSDTDVNGSYTGRPKNKKELPVQDADDL